MPTDAKGQSTGLDIHECLRRGAVGAVGAVPGTLAAHPCDGALKNRHAMMAVVQ
jgi:hypothetical protein